MLNVGWVRFFCVAIKTGYQLRNGNEITCTFNAEFLFVFEAHSRLRNYLCNKEDGQKDKLNAHVIKFTFLNTGQRVTRRVGNLFCPP